MKTSYVVLLKLVLTLCYLYEKVFCQNATDTEDSKGRGRFRPIRKQLPMDVSNISGEPDKLRCGETYTIEQEGYLIFQLNSKKSCHYTFLGSRIANCTSTVYCDGRIRLAKSNKGKCEDEVFAMTDGTIGFMSGCGTFHFGSTPRTPRNKGRDMYVYYKGVSNSSKCIAFCLEDLKMSPSLKPARPMALSKTFKGFETDNSCACGIKSISDGRIVGGTNAIKFEFPWMAALMFKGEGYERNPFCGGAIVNNLYVITAAHCFVETGVQANQIEVLFHAHVMDKGTDDGSTPADDDPEYKNIPGWALPPETDKTEYSIRRDVESVTVHPLFDRTYDYDVAIIKLKKKLTFKNPEMLPICLPEIEDILDYPDGERFLVSGWGKPTEKAKAGARVLQKLYVPYTHLTQCRTFTRATFRHICAGYLEGGKDACSGDSGGPLVHPTTPNGSQYMLAGVVSAGKGCARREVLGLYSNVYELIQWIYYHMDGAKWCEKTNVNIRNFLPA